MSGLAWGGSSRRCLSGLTRQCRSFSSTVQRPSQIGRSPISIPQGVTIQVVHPDPAIREHRREKSKRVVAVDGPLGKMEMEILPYVSIEQDLERMKLSVGVEDPEIRSQREMWGTTRAYLQNHIMGVSEGHSAVLRLVGVGYRALVEKTATTKTQEYPGQEFVVLKVGYSHPIELGVPEGVKATTPQPTRILLEGADRLKVSQFAAEIRRWRKPEPYKGKGIFVNDETIKMKAKKIK